MFASAWTTDRFRAAVLIVLGAFASYAMLNSQAFAQKVDISPKAKKAAKAADDKNKKDKADDENKSDIYTVPDGKPEELMEYVNKVLSRKAAQSAEDKEEHLKKASASAAQALDKVLANEDATDQQLKQAAEMKLQVMGLQVRLGDETAEKRMNEFMASLAKDKRPVLAEMGRQFSLILDAKKILGDPDAATREDRIKLIDKTVAFATEGKLQTENLQLAMQILSAMQDAVPQDAAKAYVQLSKELAKSDDDSLVDLGKQFEASARRLNLVGNPIKIDGETIEGEKLDWDQYKGKVLLIDFWATWCGPCIQELPNVKKNYKLYHERGFDVLGISLDDDVKKLKRFVEAQEIPWNNLISPDEDARGWNNPIAKYYGISGIPATVLVDKTGKVVALDVRGPELGRWLKKLIGPADTDSEDEKPEAKDKDE